MLLLLPPPLVALAALAVLAVLAVLAALVHSGKVSRMCVAQPFSVPARLCLGALFVLVLVVEVDVAQMHASISSRLRPGDTLL